MPFEFNAKNVFLTYPHCTLSPADALEAIRALPVLGTRPFTHCIARELHEDGSPHVHAVLSFRRPLHCRSERAFDLPDDANGGSFHPNIQRPRSLSDVLEYTTKGDDYITDHPKVVKGAVGDWGTILAESTSKADFLERVSNRYPRDYVLSYSRITEFADIRFKPEVAIYQPRHTDFTIPDELRRWVDCNVRVSCQ